MITYFNGGKNRVWYRPSGFKSGLDVKIRIIGPDFSEYPIIALKEWQDEGLYFFEFNFSKAGVWLGIIYENNIKTTSNTFYIETPTPGIIS